MEKIRKRKIKINDDVEPSTSITIFLTASYYDYDRHMPITAWKIYCKYKKLTNIDRLVLIQMYNFIQFLNFKSTVSTGETYYTKN